MSQSRAEWVFDVNVFAEPAFGFFFSESGECSYGHKGWVQASPSASDFCTAAYHGGKH